MNKIVVLFFIFLTLSVSVASQPYVGSGQTIITQVHAYPEFGGGDVIFVVRDSSPECGNGYWLSKSDPGFAATLSLILSGYQAKNSLAVYGLPGQMWDGSTGSFL